MENQQMDQRVWQRVRACQEEPAGNSLRQLQREALELAAIYRKLAAGLSGKDRELAARLAAGEQANAAALAGIGILQRQEGESVKLWQPGTENGKKQLLRCYHRTRRCLTEYMARSAEGEFGVVFQKLAQQEEHHCLLITQLLGRLR